MTNDEWKKYLDACRMLLDQLRSNMKQEGHPLEPILENAVDKIIHELQFQEVEKYKDAHLLIEPGMSTAYESLGVEINAVSDHVLSSSLSDDLTDGEKEFKFDALSTLLKSIRDVIGDLLPGWFKALLDVLEEALKFAAGYFNSRR